MKARVFQLLLGRSRNRRAAFRGRFLGYYITFPLFSLCLPGHKIHLSIYPHVKRRASFAADISTPRNSLPDHKNRHMKAILCEFLEKSCMAAQVYPMGRGQHTRTCINRSYQLTSKRALSNSLELKNYRFLYMNPIVFSS